MSARAIMYMDHVLCVTVRSEAGEESARGARDMQVAGLQAGEGGGGMGGKGKVV